MPVATSCTISCADGVTAEALHRECFCVAVDPAEVRNRIDRLLENSGSDIRLDTAHANLFSSLPVFVPQAELDRMRVAVSALSMACADARYRAAVLDWAPDIARHDPGSPGGLLGFDFHLTPEGPRLIEINTNPGGLLLNALLAEAQHLCLPDLTVPTPTEGVEVAAVDALLREWRLQGGIDPDALIAIVDEHPRQQYLYAEFVLFRRLFEMRGFRVEICDPRDLRHIDGVLRLGEARVGFVYNRLTDFALRSGQAAALRVAFLDGVVALSPHPRAHAVWADKRNLVLLGDPEFLATTALSPDIQAIVAVTVPTTRVLNDDNRDALWAHRRRLFFKPAAGFGSRASYRGDKVTRRTWEAMAGSDYVAQDIVPPSERHVAPGGDPMKVDIRCYAYEGEALFFAARLYQGQTTNFRTEGGGFAPVLTLR